MNVKIKLNRCILIQNIKALYFHVHRALFYEYKNVKKYKPKKYSDSYINHKSGIYQIRNLINNKLYIGSAVNLRERKLLRHLKQLRNGTHHNEHLQNAFNKYGEKNFVFEIIEFCSTKDILNQEQYWIDTMGVLDRQKGYNIRPETSGGPLADETKQKLRDANKNKKGVVCIELNKTYTSIKEASRSTGINDSQITRCCKGKNNTAGGYHWRYFDSDYIKYINKKNNSISIKCIETGEIFDSIKQASMCKNIDYCTLVDVISKNKKNCYTAGGYHWVNINEEYNIFDIYISDKRKKPIIDLTNGIVYSSAQEVQSITKINRNKFVNLENIEYLQINNNIYADFKKVLTYLILYVNIFSEVKNDGI